MYVDDEEVFEYSSGDNENKMVHDVDIPIYDAVLVEHTFNIRVVVNYEIDFNKRNTYKEYQERSAFTQKSFRKKNSAAIDAFEEADKYIAEHIKPYYIKRKPPKLSDLQAKSTKLKETSYEKSIEQRENSQ